MSTLEWAFWILNCLVAAYGIYAMSFKISVRSGAAGIATPAGWIWIWQAIGVVLVLVLQQSPWHLLWWFPVGYVISIAVGKVLYTLGVIDPFKPG